VKLGDEATRTQSVVELDDGTFLLVGTSGNRAWLARVTAGGKPAKEVSIGLAAGDTHAGILALKDGSVWVAVRRSLGKLALLRASADGSREVRLTDIPMPAPTWCPSGGPDPRQFRFDVGPDGEVVVGVDCSELSSSEKKKCNGMKILFARIRPAACPVLDE